MGFFGILFLGFFAVVVVGILIGLFLFLRAKKQGTVEAQKDPTENAADLNDHFNRARRMDKDGV